jgi:formyl-CoA transferase
VRSLPEAVDDPYNVDQGLIRRVTYDGWGEVRVLGSPIQLREPRPGAASPAEPRPLTPPPRLGEHNREIFRSLLGLSDPEIDRLAANGVV